MSIKRQAAIMSIFLMGCHAPAVLSKLNAETSVPEIGMTGLGDYQIGMTLEAFLIKHPNPPTKEFNTPGRPTELIEEIQNHETDPKVNLYADCPEERKFLLPSLQTNGSTFTEVELTFIAGKLTNLSLSGQVNLQNLKKIIKDLYGEGQTTTEYADECQLSGITSPLCPVKIAASGESKWKHGDIEISTLERYNIYPNGDLDYVEFAGFDMGLPKESLRVVNCFYEARNRTYQTPGTIIP